MARINAGYKIITAVPTDDTHEIVIGHAINPQRPAQFVCWDCTNKDSYDNGGYTMTYRQALAVLSERLTQRYEYLAVEAPKHDPEFNRVDIVATFVETFEDFLDDKGIDVPNPEKAEDECASTIYGTDYGILSDKIETILTDIGVLEEE